MNGKKKLVCYPRPLDFTSLSTEQRHLRCILSICILCFVQTNRAKVENGATYHSYHQQIRVRMTLPSLFAHIDGIEAVLVLDKDGSPLLKLPSAGAVDQLDLQNVIPSAQMLQDQSQRMNLKKLKTVVTYWSARQIITYNVPPLVFIVAADTNVNTGALLNLYSDFQSLVSEEITSKAL